MSLFDNSIEKDYVSYSIKVYIKDDGVPSFSTNLFAKPRNPEWVDFTDIFEYNGKNLLKSLDTITHKSEGQAGISQFLGTINKLVMDNSNGFWNKPIPYNSRFNGFLDVSAVRPPAFGHSVPTSLNTINGNIAYFTLSKNYSRTIYEGKLIKIDIQLDLQDGSISTQNAGVFVINNIELDINNRSAEMKIESLSMLLKSAEANKVKDGYHWYRNKEFSFLVTKLLESYYGSPLPSTFIINKNIIMENTGESTSDNRLLSFYNRPPGFDGENWNYNPDPCEALLLWQYNTGTLSSTTDYGNTLTFSSPLPTSGLRPIIGDVIRIKSGINEGIYTIQSISGAVATIFPYLKGKIDTAMDYTITRVYMGIGPELWVWKPETNEYYKIIDYDFDNISSSSNSQLHKSFLYGTETEYYRYKIKRLWFNSNKNTIIGVMCTDHIYYLNTNTSNEAKINSPVVFYKDIFVTYDSTSNNCHRYKVRSTEIPNVFTGEFCLREGDNASYNYLIGKLLSDRESGENIALPYDQKMIACPKYHNSSDATFNYVGSVNTIDSDITDRSDLYTFGNEFKRGYHIVQLNNNDKLFRYSMGQKGFIEFHEDGNSENGTIFICQMTRSASGVLSYEFKIKTIAVDENLTNQPADISYSTGSTIKIGSLNAHPISGCAERDGSHKIHVGLIAWNKVDTNNSNCYICSITYSSGTYTLNLDTPLFNAATNASDTFVTPIDFSVDGVTIDMLVFKRDNLTSTNNHTAYTFAHYVTGSYVESSKTFAGPLKGLVWENASTDYFYFHDAGNNVLVYSPIQTSSQLSIIADNGANPVNNAVFLSSNLILDINSKNNKSTPGAIVYGVSAYKPMPVDNQYNINVSENYNLWKYDINYTPICELADFSDLSIYDALGLIAEATNHIIGFHEDNFFYVSKDLYGEPIYIFKNNSDNKRLIKSSISTGFDEIYNYVAITPNSVNFTEPSASLGLVERTTIEQDDGSVVEEKSPDVELVIKQDDKNQKRIKLICIQGGKISDKKLHFKFINYSNTFETQLTSLFDDSNYIYINSGMDSIKTGDIVYFYSNEKTINNVDESDIFTNYTDYAYVITDPSGEDIENGKIALSKTFSQINGPPNGFKIGTLVTIVKRPGNIWSDEKTSIFGNEDNTFFENWNGTVPYYWSAHNNPILTQANSFVYGSTSVQLSNSSLSRYLYRTYTFLSSKSYTIIAWVKTKSEAYGITVQIGSGGNLFQKTVYNTNWTMIRGTFIGNDALSGIYIYCTKPGTGNKVYIDSLFICEGRTGTLPYLPVYTYNHWYPIDDSNVSFKFIETATDEEKEEESYQEGSFKVGDYIDIDCTGESLSKDETSIQSAMNSASIEAYTKKEYPSIENRFVNLRTAKVMASMILNEYQYPHYTIKLSAPLVLLLNFISDKKLAMYGYEDDFTFPLNENYQVQGYLKSFSYNLKNGTTEAEIRLKDSY